MDEIEFDEDSEVEKSINAWRQSERKIMIDTVQDLIQSAHKYAKSQYTPSAQRARWTKLAGQLIWYKDQILKNFSLEAMYIDLQALKKKVIESQEHRNRQSLVRNYPRIVFPKKEDRKAENGETPEATNADEPEPAKEKAP